MRITDRGLDFEVQIPEWFVGQTVVDFFGPGADALDSICIVASYQRVLPRIMSIQIDLARQDGHSWTDIAAALGTSRQAATKRYGQRESYLPN